MCMVLFYVPWTSVLHGSYQEYESLIQTNLTSQNIANELTCTLVNL